MNYKFRKRPVVVEAFQMTFERSSDTSEWPEWLHEAKTKGPDEEGALCDIGEWYQRLAVTTLEGTMEVSWGDWIIQGVQGELYPCKPDIFTLTYEEMA